MRWTISLSLLLLPEVLSQSLPYNPTTILLQSSPNSKQDLAYIFSVEGNAPQLISINISSRLSSYLPSNILSSNLPFWNDQSTAFVPSLSSSGDILVYAGSCSTSSSSKLWRYTIPNSSTVSDGTWSQDPTSTASDVTIDELPGADFLSGALTFSSRVDADTDAANVYIFGGMCPTADATPSTWQSAANYSNCMLRLAPPASGTRAYSLDVLPDRGPPIAEAGFTLTGLTPTYSNASRVAMQQQNFVLVGGHTQTAFINMSQVAIWSLPEETWNFVTVDSTPSNANTELMIKSAVISIDSRSGHTAVLTEDGKGVIVLGGWVGDLSQAADPQLVVLNIGAGYGGTGDWCWSVPASQPSGSGVFGHGAVMLPGNVMMIVGGYDILPTSNSRKRGVNAGSQAMFFNATSLTWASEYTNPSSVAHAEPNVASSMPSNSKSTKSLGLGLGLGLGLAAILIALGIYFCYSRHLKRRRDSTRERQLQSLSQAAPNFYASPAGEMIQNRNEGSSWSRGSWDHDRGDVPSYESLGNGVHDLGVGEYPTPKSSFIPRKPLQYRSARGMYQQAPTFDGGMHTHTKNNSLGTAGPIHPIIEIDEDIALISPISVGQEFGGDQLYADMKASDQNNRHSDPFRDPPPTNFSVPRERRNTPSPESPAREREREVQEWVSDWAAADALLSSQARIHSSAGRISPSRRAQLIRATSSPSSVSGAISEVDDSGRTASNLSERSMASTFISRSGSSSQGTRSNSLRGFIATAMNPFSSGILGSTVETLTISPTSDKATPRGPRALIQPPGSSSSATASFNTAQTSFTALQAEGESLLPRPTSPSEFSPTKTTTTTFVSGSPSKNKPFSKNRSQGWLGSIRKAFTSDDRVQSPSPTAPSFSTSSDEQSPIHTHAGGIEPRRAVSAGATLWRRKQGKIDWEDSAGQRSNTFTTSGPLLAGERPSVASPMAGERRSEDSDEWDIERAVENRVVQVMFTVPREKLRVVNQDVREEGSEEDFGDVVEKSAGVRSDIGDTMRMVDEEKDDGRQREKAKGKVQEIVQRMEERSGSRSPGR